MAQNNQQFDIRELADKWARGTLTAEEQAYLEKWYAGFNDEQVTLTGSRHQNSEALRTAMLARINAEAGRAETPVRTLWPLRRIVAAASVLLFLSTGAYFLLHKQQPQPTGQNQTQDIRPGSNKAILITHGKRISITDARNGLLAQQENISITKAADGKLVYQNTAGSHETMVYDTLVIPRGGQHELELADGSKVLLNADTRIRYPERFAANERRIELISGEARFRVKHNAAIPFLVVTKGQVIKDIGTDFDVNAYDDEPVIKTTLVEGSVEITKGAQSRILKPGQQAISHADNPLQVQTANIDQVTAWQNGKFYFEKTGLRELMRQVSRWYNIDVVYEGDVPDDAFTGQPSRKVNLSQMLKILELGDVHFKIEPGKGKSAGRLIFTH